MDARRNFEAVASRLDPDLEQLSRAVPPLAVVRSLFVDEVFGSCALAGSAFSRAEIEALIERDAAAAGHSVADNVLVADYGLAAHMVRAAPPPRRRPFIAIDEIAALHAAATARTLGSRPGRWREATAPAFPSGMVPPPAWLVPRDVAAFAERFAPGPPRGTHPAAWLADAHARFLRVHPFDAANGRTGRLVTNLLGRRAGLPPLVLRRRDVARYVGALRRADSRDPWPLALVFARIYLDGTTRLLAAGANDLRPLAELASGSRRAALYKAAQRGRLRTVRERGQLLTNPAWISAYEGRDKTS